MNKYIDKETLKTIILASFVLIISLISFSKFLQRQEENLEKTFHKTIDDFSSNQRLSIYESFTADINGLKNIALNFDDFDSNDGELIAAKLNNLIINSRFSKLAYVDNSGLAITNDNERFDLSSRDYFKNALNHKFGIADPIFAIEIERTAIPIIQPVCEENMTKAFVVGYYTLEDINSMILPSFDNYATTHIVSKNGEVVATTNIEILKKLLTFGENFDENLYNSILSDINVVMTNDMKSELQIIHVGERYFINFQPIGINDWYMFLMVNDKFLADDFLKIKVSSLYFLTFITFLVIMSSIYIFKQRDKYNEKIIEVSKRDPLTKLYNRNSYIDSIVDIMGRYPRDYYTSYMIDLVDFSLINQNIGRQNADKLLIQLSKNLKNIFLDYPQDSYSIARVSSNAFAIFFVNSQIDLDDIDRKRLKLLESTKYYDDYKVNFYQAVYEAKETDSCDEIFENTMIAIQYAKDKIDYDIVYFNKKYKDYLSDGFIYKTGFEKAIKNKEFKVFFQAKVDSKSSKVFSAEALIRWEKDGKLISPLDFISLFETTRQIVKLDYYVFEEVCNFLSKNMFIDEYFTCSVNFSRCHIEDESFVKRLIDITDKYQVNPSKLIIEFTESVLIENIANTNKIIQELESYGFKVSMDDFGSGYSSIASLAVLNVDEIKLDKSLIENIVTKESSLIILKNIINMANELKLKVIAEGVETKEQLAILHEINCHLIQGYYFSKPLSEINFIRFLAKTT